MSVSRLSAVAQSPLLSTSRVLSNSFTGFVIALILSRSTSSRSVRLKGSLGFYSMRNHVKKDCKRMEIRSSSDRSPIASHHHGYGDHR